MNGGTAPTTLASTKAAIKQHLASKNLSCKFGIYRAC